MTLSHPARRSISTLLAFLILLPLGFAQRTEEFQIQSPAVGNAIHFGSGVAVDGEWAVVADYNATTSSGSATGACVLYKRTDFGWTEWQTLTPPPIVSFLQEYGFSVALHGDELVVGARRGGIDNAGRVFVYHLINDSWRLVQQLRAFDGGSNFGYGKEVEFDDQTLVVGSPNYPDPTYVLGGRGTFYVYVRSASGWVFSQRIPLLDPATTPHPKWGGLGFSCALEDDVLVVGAPGLAGHGMAFVYRRQQTGWVMESPLYLPQYTAAAPLELGWSVDISNGVIAVGAPVTGPPLPLVPSTVAFFEFDTASQAWGLKQTVRASDWNLTPGGWDYFGRSLSMSGDHLVVGALLGSYSAPYAGTAYHFKRINGQWIEAERLLPTDPNSIGPSPAQFSSSVALDVPSGRILIGAQDGEVQGFTGLPGKVYFFDINQGTVVCAGTPNVTLKPTRLTVTGSRRVADANLSLSVYDAPRGLMGLYLVGPGGPPVPFGAGGTLCVGQPFSRLTGIKAIGPEGSAMYRIDFTSAPAVNLICPGATLTFQFAHRDKVAGTGQPTINASDAVEVVFE